MTLSKGNTVVKLDPTTGEPIKEGESSVEFEVVDTTYNPDGTVTALLSVKR